MIGPVMTQPERLRYYGKYPALVVDNEAGEGQHLGKIKVRIPAILEEDGAGQPKPVEVLARPCLPPGFFFVPSKDDHVWVEFAGGDLDTPIWVGVWYPDDAPPATAGGAAPDQRHKVIRTPAGHVVTLDDEKRAIVVQDAFENRLILKEEKVVIEQKGGARVELSDGTVLVEANSVALGGSSGRALLTVTEQVKTYLEAHTHTGNLGAPTGPPTPPATVDAWLTRKTKAE